MKSPEEIARELTGCSAEPCDVAYCRDVKKRIAAAIREARAEVFEAAARLALGDGDITDDCARLAVTLRKLAQEARKL